ncbi:hypothetical protein [Oceanobacillus sp. Castelsardo]|uniref:hypothetical protein n=1 Tax=Oceanobacillus sp. Castelsardo TaxID=1851204 RepID=UPI0009EF20E7|nr:hypothetical protein [Oceanobacillus sp. Castelsardo]
MADIKKLKIPELKKHLKEYDQGELIKLVADLYRQNHHIQSYLSVKFLGGETIQDLYENAR